MLDVLIIGGGPTGLALGVELRRRGVRCRIVEARASPIMGSKGRGLQPRTLEVFDVMGVLPEVFAAGSDYPRFQYHLGPLALTLGSLSKRAPPRPGVPYPNLWMLPQGRTEAILRARYLELGGEWSPGLELTGFEQDADAVAATLGDGERVRARFLVGSDGGKSTVRRGLGLALEGKSLSEERVVVADVRLRGLSRERWHLYPFARGGLLSLCPLPRPWDFQLLYPRKAGVPLPELSRAGLGALVDQATRGRAQLEDVTWTGVWHPHVRMVSRYRVGRVFLAGDAAHVHPPTGGQGLNTGVQDAFNLGWKLAAVCRGAAESLLDSYEAERLPVAAKMLGLSSQLYEARRLKRGEAEKQLGISYRAPGEAREGLAAGDRAPDAAWVLPDGTRTRVLEMLRAGGELRLEFTSQPEAARIYRGLAWARVRPDGYLAAVG